MPSDADLASHARDIAAQLELADAESDVFYPHGNNQATALIEAGLRIMLEQVRLRAHQQARIFELSMEGYGAAMAVVAAAFPDEQYSQVDLIHIAFSIATTEVGKRALAAEAALAAQTLELEKVKAQLKAERTTP